MISSKCLLFLCAVLFPVFAGAFPNVQECELPSCDLVLKSRLYSPRCSHLSGEPHTVGWPLLVTGTPRSATVHMTKTLQYYGAAVQDDWGNPNHHGSVSWIFAFEDPQNFGPGRTHGKKFAHVVHQIREPLKSITSMCTEPLLHYRPPGFLEKHINYTRAHEQPASEVRAALQFYVEWHAFLDELRLPIYRVEEVKPVTVFQLGGIENVFQDKPEQTHRKSTNSRKHRDTYTWQELFTADPYYTRRLWNMAARYGYHYEVGFEDLKCQNQMPTCSKKNQKHPSPFCPPGTHPDTSRADVPLPPKVRADSGHDGLIDTGCWEYRNTHGLYIGLDGIHHLS